jgi:hypothetical protein
VGLTARAQAASSFEEFDETRGFGLATMLGINTDAGIAGLPLGGGWLATGFQSTPA